MARSSNPVLVFVHGAWHPASTWDLLRTELEHDFVIRTPQLISVGTDPKISSYDDAAIVRGVIMKHIEQGKDVVVITHSYSAIPVGDALEGLSKRARKTQGKSGGVTAQVHLTSWTLAKGQSLTSFANGKYHPAILFDEEAGLVEVDPNQRHDWFYNDLTVEDSKPIRAALKPHSLASFGSPLKYDSYSDMPVTYVKCNTDNCIPPTIQEMMIEAAGGREKITVIEIESSHSPMLSMPKRCAEIIVQAAESAKTAA